VYGAGRNAQIFPAILVLLVEGRLCSVWSADGQKPLSAFYVPLSLAVQKKMRASVFVFVCERLRNS